MRYFSFSIAAALAACCLLTGCISSADSLLTPPVLSDEQLSVYSALKDAVGDDISLVYPKSGSYRSAVVFADLDMDDFDEAAIFYISSRSPENGVRINILDNDGNGWRSVYDHAGAGASVEEVFFIDPGGRGINRMAVGYGYISPAEKALRVYSYSDGILSLEYSDSYSKLLTLDLDNDSGMDIALIRANSDSTTAGVSLITDRGEGTQCVSSVDLSSSAVDLSMVTGGFIGNDTPALFVDELMMSGNLSTEIVYCINGELRNPAALSGSEIPSLTTRPQGLYSRDADGDGIIEIPSREPFPGYRDSGEIQYITDWNVFDNYTVKKKYSSLTNISAGYCFMLPGRWEGLVTVKNDTLTGERVFYKFNSSLSESRLELMRILVCPLAEEQDRTNEGYFPAARSDTAVYMVRFGDTEDSLVLTTSEVINNFYLI